MPTSDQQRAFEMLHRSVQKAVARLGWRQLYPVQVRTILAFFASVADLIVAAPTAGGKTAAAFLPILSALLSNPKLSVQVLAIDPLRALINDQHDRLIELARFLGIPIHRWHGDVSGSAKNYLLKNPGGIVLMTPESLEGQFMLHPENIKKLFFHVDHVVIDELHAFRSEERGAHLASLLSRFEDAIGRRPRRLALSATMGDLEAAKTFLNLDNPDSVVVIEQAGHDREIRAMLRAYLRPLYEQRAR
jgi:ATP-dependent Lhr-like helicase